MRWILMALVALAATAQAGPPPTHVLAYQGRYNCQAGEPDHLMDALILQDGRVIVAGNRGLALVDLADLPPRARSSTSAG